MGRPVRAEGILGRGPSLMVSGTAVIRSSECLPFHANRSAPACVNRMKVPVLVLHDPAAFYRVVEPGEILVRRAFDLV